MIFLIRLFLLILFVGIEAPLFSMMKKGNGPLFTSEAIGVKTFSYQDTSRNRPVVVEFWYPTDEQDIRIEENSGSVWVHPKEARNVSLSSQKSRYPLILMSHGHRGDRRERTWLVDALVRQGFVVASVDHYGSAWHQFHPLASLCFWDRAKDVTFALSKVLEEKELSGYIDQDKIGFIGYSMGGMTGLALAGAQADHAKEVALAQLKGLGQFSPEVLETIDFSEAEKNYREPRIRSMLLICPATFVYRPEGLKGIQIPVGLIASVDDELLPHEEHAMKVIQSLQRLKTKLMKNRISHYAFLNRMTEKGFEILQKGVSKSDTSNWGSIHKEAADFSVRFFQETLKERESKT